MAGSESFAVDEQSARVLLSIASEPGDRTTGRVLATIGAVETVRLVESTEPFSGQHRAEREVWRNRLAARMNVELTDRALEDREDLGLELIIPGDPGWPVGLADLGDRAPIMLWALSGDLTLLTAPPARNVTVVGARAASRYGIEATGLIAKGLSEDGYRIVSGGSYGIEITAHRTAASTRGGATIMVLPNGLDRIYPAGNEELLRRAAHSGLMVSELPPGSPPTRSRFVQRGRIMAALSATTVVVEAGTRPGSLSVAREADQLGRAVGAVPGPMTSATSAGPHLLVREGTAQLVTSEWDVEQLAQDWATGIGRDRRFDVPDALAAGAERAGPTAPRAAMSRGC